MQLIQTVTVGSGGAASIVFGTGGTIPQTFTDLVIVVSARSSFTNEDINITFNSGGTYSARRLAGTGSATQSDTSTGLLRATSSSDTANTFSNCQVYVPNYRSNTAKSYSVDSVSENNGTRAIQIIGAGLWSGTDAINLITLSISGQNFEQHSSASLYGITAGSSGGVVVS